jgi:hypothetical protein
MEGILGKSTAILGQMVLGRVDGSSGLSTNTGVASSSFSAIDSTWQIAGAASTDTASVTLALGAFDISTIQILSADSATIVTGAIASTYTLGAATRDTGIATITLSAIDANYSAPTLSFTPVALLMQGAY